MAKTAAERKRKQREKLKASGLFEEFKKKESEKRKRQRRLIKQKASIDELNASRRKKAQEMRSYRNKIKQIRIILEAANTPAIEETPTKAFASNSSYGKAVAKAKRNLPFSPTKCRAVVYTLAREIIPHIIIPKRKNSKNAINPNIKKSEIFMSGMILVAKVLGLKTQQ